MITFDTKSVQHIAEKLVTLKTIDDIETIPNIFYGEILVYKSSMATYVFQSSERIDSIKSKADKAIVGAIPGSIARIAYRGLDLRAEIPIGTPSLFTIEHIMYPTSKIISAYYHCKIV